VGDLRLTGVEKMSKRLRLQVGGWLVKAAFQVMSNSGHKRLANSYTASYWTQENA
jgi:hypothetical protein